MIIGRKGKSKKCVTGHTLQPIIKGGKIMSNTISKPMEYKHIVGDFDFKAYYESVKRNVERFPNECAAELQHTYAPFAQRVKHEQDTYRFCDREYIIYKLMQATYPPILELYARAEVLSLPYSGMFTVNQYPALRERFIHSNKLRTARFHRNLQANGQTEEQYYREFYIECKHKQYAMIAQLIETHPVINPDVDFKQFISDVNYANRVSEEIITHDDIYAEIY